MMIKMMNMMIIFIQDDDNFDVFCLSEYQEVCSGLTTIAGFYRYFWFSHPCLPPFLNCLCIYSQLFNSLCLRSTWLLPLCWYGMFTNLYICIYLIGSLVQDLFFSSLTLTPSWVAAHTTFTSVSTRLKVMMWCKFISMFFLCVSLNHSV